MSSVGLGSPAHAGIGPYVYMSVGVLGGFPRARGDRPLTKPNTCYILQVPPRTRG